MNGSTGHDPAPEPTPDSAADAGASQRNETVLCGGEPMPGMAVDAAVLAHELRGPLAVVAGYLDLLGRARDEQTRDYALGAAQRAVARMDALIDDVLDTVHGHYAPALRREPVDPASIARALLADVPTYQSRVSFANSCTMLARADGLRLERVLCNVLDNALKFSPATAKVRLALVDDGGCVRFVVEDEGPGIPMADAERLTHHLERLDRDAAIPGYGIGLGVAVELVEGMDGQLVLGNRDDGSGARVEIILPGTPVVGED